MVVLDSQLKIDCRAIENALLRCDVDFLKFKLNQLQLLNSVVRLPQCEAAYKNSVENMIRFCKTYFNDASEIFIDVCALLIKNVDEAVISKVRSSFNKFCHVSVLDDTRLNHSKHIESVNGLYRFVDKFFAFVSTHAIQI
jgi:hypothetical protein